MIQTGIKPQRSFVDPFYKPEYKGSYYLSVLIGKDALYAAVLDLKNNTYVAVEEYIFEGVQNDLQLKEYFENCFKSSLILQSEFQKVNFGIINEYNSLIPEAFYDESNNQDFFEFTHGEKRDYSIKEDNLINIRARNIFAIPVLLETSINSCFPIASVKHFSTSLIDGLCLKFKQYEGEKVVVHIQYSHFELLYFKNGTLHFFNSFNYTTAEDFIYYILFTFEQLGLSTEKIEVEILGEADTESSAYSILYKYVRNVSFGDRPKVLNYSNIFDTVSSNQYFNLFQQFLCA